ARGRRRPRYHVGASPSRRTLVAARGVDGDLSGEHPHGIEVGAVPAIPERVALGAAAGAGTVRLDHLAGDGVAPHPHTTRVLGHFETVNTRLVAQRVETSYGRSSPPGSAATSTRPSGRIGVREVPRRHRGDA